MNLRPQPPFSRHARLTFATLSLAALAGCGLSDGMSVDDPATRGEERRSRRDLALPRDSASPRDLAMRPDLAGVPDLAMPPDFATPPDFAIPPDLAAPPDVATQKDLAAQKDLASPPDLVVVMGGGPTIAGCPVFPADNEWNRDVSGDPVDPGSATYLTAMNAVSAKLHPDFGSDPTYGIPWITVPGTQPKVAMTFTWPDESDPGPYPIPANAPIEGGANSVDDRHVLVVDRDHCLLYETYNSFYVNPGWSCDSGARFDLHSNALRPDYWTSADAAGLPVLPGLVLLSEVQAGEIRHALRFTVKKTQKAFVHPATHYASADTSAALPPMGLRVRLKASFDISGYNATSKVILTAMKKYGMFLADNGSDWYFTGETNALWNDTDLSQLKNVPASSFEVVKLGTIIK